ncbi:YkgJ family cysteine cluster protein [Methanospirillum lacunae]|uniref:Zinc/iron-chelating domain-containing protein n=1 Tax=Methanospirillum lacunae TaxID=668570 RepID=A0A2V2N0L9_9EURY|nr:hypothetical protein DK846_08935 [Methanospirillum lacunae]
MDPDQTPGLAPVCLRCGRCCRYGPSINANSTDLKRWVIEDRTDILTFFQAYCTDGSYVNCAFFKNPQSLSRVLWTDMINPDTNDYYKDCPFLRPLSENKWYCSIYETRPAICTRFRPWEWGEKGEFFNCPVVERMSREASTSFSGTLIHSEKEERTTDTCNPGHVKDNLGTRKIHHHP